MRRFTTVFLFVLLFSETQAQTESHFRFGAQIESGLLVPSLISSKGDVDLFRPRALGAQAGVRFEFWHKNNQFIVTRALVGSVGGRDMQEALSGSLIGIDEGFILEHNDGEISMSISQFLLGYGFQLSDEKYRHVLLGSGGITRVNPFGDLFWKTKVFDSNYQKIHRLREFGRTSGWTVDLEYAIHQMVYVTRYGNWEVMAAVAANVQQYTVNARYETLDILGEREDILLTNDGILATFRFELGGRLHF